MKTDSKLIQKSFFGILIVNFISMVSAILCVMIDAIVIGQFLGADAMAASGLLQPVVMLCNVFGALFGPGVGIVCTRFLGMAKRERVNQVFSIVMIALTASGIVLSAVLFVTSSAIAAALGGSTDNEQIVLMIQQYLRGLWRDSSSMEKPLPSWNRPPDSFDLWPYSISLVQCATPSAAHIREHGS